MKLQEINRNLGSSKFLPISATFDYPRARTLGSKLSKSVKVIRKARETSLQLKIPVSVFSPLKIAPELENLRKPVPFPSFHRQSPISNLTPRSSNTIAEIDKKKKTAKKPSQISQKFHKDRYRTSSIKEQRNLRLFFFFSLTFFDFPVLFSERLKTRRKREENQSLFSLVSVDSRAPNRNQSSF